jgi:CheY-like chemotaxis protein
MSDAGHLEVTVRRIEGGKVQVCFEDGGPGFAPEQLEAAFEPFHTTRAAGTGLGLSIVHGIVTHLGGEVTLGNARGGGAKICTTWEVVEDDGPSEPPHVLVVEDDALNRKLTMRLLGVLGYTSEGTETAEQALERIETSAFDMALIDINLGSGMKGSELASRLVASNAIEQVVFMSANHDLAEGLKNISPHFLSKPFTRSQLNEMMKSCVAG